MLLRSRLRRGLWGPTNAGPFKGMPLTRRSDPEVGSLRASGHAVGLSVAALGLAALRCGGSPSATAPADASTDADRPGVVGEGAVMTRPNTGSPPVDAGVADEPSGSGGGSRSEE